MLQFLTKNIVTLLNGNQRYDSFVEKHFLLLNTKECRTLPVILFSGLGKPYIAGKYLHEKYE